MIAVDAPVLIELLTDGPRADAGTLEPAADVTVRYDGKAQVVRFPRTAR